jgi:phosphotransferase system enzyme I (PtsI)
VGIAAGQAQVVGARRLTAPRRSIKPQEVAVERGRFQAAIAKSLRQLDKLRVKSTHLPGNAAEELGFLFDAHTSMLSGSRLTRGVDTRIGTACINAEAAVEDEISALTDSFAALEDRYIAGRIADVREVGDRLIRNLLKQRYETLSPQAEGPIILVAEELTPAETALIQPGRVVGIATEQGGPQSHTAIMARALGIPAVMGTRSLLRHVQAGLMVCLNGGAGTVLVDPDQAAITAHRRAQAVADAERRAFKAQATAPAVTPDGTAFQLRGNVDMVRDLDACREAGADGIGLFRTEYLFLGRAALPSEAEQTEAYTYAVTAMRGAETTIRTLDVGGDKIAPNLKLSDGDATNPALGLRAIRLSMKHPAVFDTQLAAILRAAAAGPVKILVPMVSALSEIAFVRARLTAQFERLHAEGVALPPNPPPLGIMIEVPAAAIQAPVLAPRVDFLSIGTNDLVQYTLAIDRGDEEVASLYEPFHPAVLSLLDITARAGRAAGVPVAVCGEMAADPLAMLLLAGLGITELSMSPPALPRARAIIRALDMTAARATATAALQAEDSDGVMQLLQTP